MSHDPIRFARKQLWYFSTLIPGSSILLFIFGVASIYAGISSSDSTTGMIGFAATLFTPILWSLGNLIVALIEVYLNQTQGPTSRSSAAATSTTASVKTKQLT